MTFGNDPRKGMEITQLNQLTEYCLQTGNNRMSYSPQVLLYQLSGNWCGNWRCHQKSVYSGDVFCMSSYQQGISFIIDTLKRLQIVRFVGLTGEPFTMFWLTVR